MRKYLGLAIVFALVVAVGPALAGESFHALSQLPAVEQTALTPLPDAQLAIIEGTDKDGYKKSKKHSSDDVEVCIVCLNISTVTQSNAAVGNFNTQVNAAVVDQEIN
jgi:hypothetical protein